MKYIPTSLLIKNPRVLSSKALKGVAIIFGVGAFIFAVFLSYQYMNKASKATTPVVTYNIRAGSCTTSAGLNKCNLEIQKNDTFDVIFELNSAEIMSGADLYFRYNEPASNVLEYINHTDTTNSFGTTVIEKVHHHLKDSKLLHLVVVNKGNNAALKNTALITLHFKAINTGTSYVNMLTSASTIVGPVDPLEYEISPQNLPGTPEDKMANIYHAYITVIDSTFGATNTPIPPTATNTPVPPTSTPVPPTATAVPTTDPCPNLLAGNASCDSDGVVDLIDFACWRYEFINRSVANNCGSADFNINGKTDLYDFTIWRSGFINANQP